jgi:two-component system, LytTR family, response regulator
MIRALIVDDEILAREEMEALLKETGEFSVVGKCANAIEALQAIKRENPDVLFLDIQMPGITGLELLSMIDEEVMPVVVFVTAYDEYALKAFEESALDYLLKPVEQQRLAKTVTKLHKRLGERNRPAYIGPEITKIPCVVANRIKLITTGDVE